jgi:hypothetical protein
MPSPLLGTDITIALLSALTARDLLGMAATGAARLLRTTSSVSILARPMGIPTAAVRIRHRSHPSARMRGSRCTVQYAVADDSGEESEG